MGSIATGGARARATAAVLVALVVLLAAGAACGFGFLVWQRQGADAALRETLAEPLPVVEPAFEPEEAALPENPIDFEALQAENPDLHAWLYIPNTNVNLPVAQRVGDDFFYLDHDRRGEPDAAGTVFSQTANARDFSDPVTVLYGHNLVSGAMFSTLHCFEDPAFFEANEELFVYLPGRVLFYRVVAAYEYDDRHILNSFDFADPAAREAYFASVLAPDDPRGNVREGAALEAGSRILQLSTCRSALTEDPVRYLVTAVLVEERATA